MNIAIVSYSYTGNNDRLAACVARDLKATHIKITTQRPQTMVSIIMDMSLSRIPKVQPDPKQLKSYDMIIFCVPVWMGHVASSLRAYLRYLKSSPQAYGFFSISGGADGGNPKLYGELVKRTGAKPVILLDQHIKELAVFHSEPTRSDTSAYKISEAEADRLSAIAIAEVKKLSIYN